MPRRNGDEDAVLWRVVKAVGQLEKKIDHLQTCQDRFIRMGRNQRTWLSKVRAELVAQKKYTKELETVLRLQREDDK